MSTDLIVHGFAGIGWSEALRTLGLSDVGLELNTAACATRAGAGHTTVQCDVAQYATWPFKGRTWGGIFSPPCPPFSKSGNGRGAHDLPLVLQAIEDLSRGKDTRAVAGAACQDERSILTAEPMRWIYDLLPEWVCMEQVPSVLPVWEQYAGILARWGYSAVCGVLDAADFGLGQRRKRAVLVASRAREVVLPAPTHGGLGQPPLVAMADVIGWGYTRRPAPTVTGGGTATGGAEPFGNGTRRAMRAAMERPGEWLPKPGGGSPTSPSVADCSALQGFRPGLQFAGGLGAKYLQAGNAFPPPVAEHVVSAATGIPLAASPLLAAA